MWYEVIVLHLFPQSESEYMVVAATGTTCCSTPPGLIIRGLPSPDKMSGVNELFGLRPIYMLGDNYGRPADGFMWDVCRPPADLHDGGRLRASGR